MVDVSAWKVTWKNLFSRRLLVASITNDNERRFATKARQQSLEAAVLACTHQKHCYHVIIHDVIWNTLRSHRLSTATLKSIGFTLRF